MNLKLFTKATKRTFITLTNYPRKTPYQCPHTLLCNPICRVYPSTSAKSTWQKCLNPFRLVINTNKNLIYLSPILFF